MAASLPTALTTNKGGTSNEKNHSSLDIGNHCYRICRCSHTEDRCNPRPHAEILEVIKPLAAEKGINIEIVVFTDYVLPNLALADGELDANFFQHVPYLDTFKSDRRLDLASLVAVHVEPMGLYSNKIKSLSELKNGALIGIPNDPTNGGRALLLLQTAGLIEVDKAAGITPTVFDITKNPKNLKFTELEAAMLPRSLQDLDAAVINTNYALEGGLVPTKDALIMEGEESPYANIVAVRTADLEKPEFAILAELLTSDAVREFIETEYKGSISYSILKLQLETPSAYRAFLLWTFQTAGYGKFLFKIVLIIMMVVITWKKRLLS